MSQVIIYPEMTHLSEAGTEPLKKCPVIVMFPHVITASWIALDEKDCREIYDALKERFNAR